MDIKIIICFIILFTIIFYLSNNLILEPFKNQKQNVYIFASHKYTDETNENVKNIELKNNDIIALCNDPNEYSVRYLLTEKYPFRKINYRFIRGPQYNGVSGKDHIFNKDNFQIFEYKTFNHKGCRYYVFESDATNFDDLALRYNIPKENIKNELHSHDKMYMVKAASKIDVPNYNAYDYNYDGPTFYGKRCKSCFYYPSSGYVALKRMKKLYPNANIYLVGFTFKAGWIHNMKYEKNHALSLKNVYIL